MLKLSKIYLKEYYFDFFSIPNILLKYTKTQFKKKIIKSLFKNT